MFFVYAMTTESGGWHPTPSEAFVVPLSWIGAIFFPIAGVALWHGGRPSGKRMGCVGLALMIGSFVLLLLMLMAGVWTLSRRASQQAAPISLQPASVDPADVADGFDFPVGPPDGKGFHVVREAFGKDGPHAGEDWNGDGAPNSDLGAPIHAVAHGLVVFSENSSVGHGHVIILRHNYWDDKGRLQVCESSYHHLQARLVKAGDRVKRGQKIGTMGNANGLYPVHLHFELRKTPGMGLEQSKYEKSTKNYWAPSEFIGARRPLVKKPASAISRPPALQMRWVQASASAETEELELRGGSQEKLYVEKAVQLDATAVQLVGVVANETDGGMRIGLTLTKQGAERFAQITREGKGRRLAIVLGGRLWTAPVIREEIAGGMLEISGAFTEAEARTLADEIRAHIPTGQSPPK